MSGPSEDYVQPSCQTEPLLSDLKINSGYSVAEVCAFAEILTCCEVEDESLTRMLVTNTLGGSGWGKRSGIMYVRSRGHWLLVPRLRDIRVEGN